MSISSTGRYVVFASSVGNLVSNDTEQVVDVFWHDFGTGQTRLVSAASNGSGGTDPLATSELDQEGGGDDVTPNGRYVVFDSSQPLVPNDTNHDPTGRFETPDVFVKDMWTGRIERVSVSAAGEQANGPSWVGSISGDGRFVVFMTGATNIVGRGSGYAIAGYDVATGAPVLLSRSSSGAVAAGGCQSEGYPIDVGASWNPQVDGDGQETVFTSCARNFSAAADRNPGLNVFVRFDGPPLGVGGLVAAGRLTVMGSRSFGRTGILTAPDRDSSAPAATAVPDARLVGASLVYRASEEDLLIREPVQRMLTVTGTPTDPGVLYGFDLTASGIHYQVRAQRVPGPDYDPAGGASFGLFREQPDGVWTEVSALFGGYGTTGDEVVFALPLRDIGLQAGGRLSGLTAFTAVGSYLTGPGLVLDKIIMSR
ncbi:MAG TPA: hypothetical protein VNE21_03015 [Mycobacteriales bacterium]|nr:hypothetical protein [Mycobacteriales bacterium]